MPGNDPGDDAHDPARWSAERMTCALTRPCWQIAPGRSFSPDSCHPLAAVSCAHCPVLKKSGALPRHRGFHGCTCQGPEQHFLHYAPFPGKANSAVIRMQWPRSRARRPAAITGKAASHQGQAPTPRLVTASWTRCSPRTRDRRCAGGDVGRPEPIAAGAAALPRSVLPGAWHPHVSAW